MPKFVSRAFGERAIGFFVTTEDGSDPDNRIVSCGQAGLPMMNYDLRRLKPADKERRRLVRAFIAKLIRAGLVGVDRYIGMAGTAHALGTLVTGTEPETSVTDTNSKVHRNGRAGPADEPKSGGSALAGRRYLVDSMRNVEACRSSPGSPCG